MSLIRKHGAVLQAWACLDLVKSRIRHWSEGEKYDQPTYVPYYGYGVTQSISFRCIANENNRGKQ